MEVNDKSGNIVIYTDGSCHTQRCIGGWVALIFIEKEKTVLTGLEFNTTHNRMELTAVIKAIEYVREMKGALSQIKIYADSQYVIGLTARREKLSSHNFETKKGNEIRNADLVKELLKLEECMPLKFVKVKAHQKANEIINYNIEADKLARKITREAVASYRVEK